MEIIRGTTPILIFTFDTIEVSDIDVAYLTVIQNGKTILTKQLSDGTVGENTLSWQLSQEDTLKLSCWSAVIYCDWRLNSGIRGASNPFTVGVSNSGKTEVI